mgnify:CR=1 FL=1
MKAIEFYTTPEGEVTMRPIGEAERQLKETDTDFIQAFLAILREFYPELNETFIGSFFGVQAHFAQYNFGGTTPFTTVKNNRYQGNLIGCGVTYGHQWLLSTFWSLEASISVGYAHLTYDKYGPAKGDALIEKSHSNYVGPTQLGISFIYFIQ